MTASENSFIGIAKQTAKGTPNVTDGSFDYMLFREAAIGPTPMFVPLDPEAGGGAMARNVIKAGIATGGKLSFIPRPKTLGHAFLGMTGAVSSVAGAAASFAHTFNIADDFVTPWYTLRHAPGNLLGEQLSDMKYSSMTLAWRGGKFVEGELGFQGSGVPVPVSTAAWAAKAKVDGGPQFLAPLGTIELPTGTPAIVTAGTFTAHLGMPMDEQWIVGSYSPHNMQIVQRAYVLSLALKIDDAALYQKIMYDPAAGSTWLPDIMREANFKLEFKSDQLAEPGVPYSFGIAANGGSGAAANVVWSCQPIPLKAGKQVMLAVTGTFLADPAGGSPLTLSLVNQTPSY